MSLATLVKAGFARSLLQPLRCISTTPCARGLEEFFDTPVKEGERVTAGTCIAGYDAGNYTHGAMIIT